MRFIVGDPDNEVTRRREEHEGVPLTVGTRITLDELFELSDVTGIETCFSDDHIAMSVFTFDDQMLVTPHLATPAGHGSPMPHLKRQQADGMFDRFAFHAAELWGHGRPVSG